MNHSPERLLPVAALRPWPYGPPLRGRAPHSDGEQRAAQPRVVPVALSSSKSTRSGHQETAPVGSLACPHLTRCIR